MTPAEAETISELWALAYPLIGADPRKAAALQIAIWEVVGGNQFHLTSGRDYGASRLLSIVEAPNYAGPRAGLMALTGPGQDFVIDPTDHVSVSVPVPPRVPVSVPDTGSTLGLFGLALTGLVVLRLATARRRMSSSEPSKLAYRSWQIRRPPKD
jgi:VPDSG-CTERM motif